MAQGVGDEFRDDQDHGAGRLGCERMSETFEAILAALACAAMDAVEREVATLTLTVSIRSPSSLGRRCPVLPASACAPGQRSVDLAATVSLPALHRCSRLIASPSNTRKSMSAGVDIGQWCGYGFSRNRDQRGLAETNWQAVVQQLQCAGRCGGGVPKPGLLQDGDGTDDRTGWPAVIRAAVSGTAVAVPVSAVRSTQQ